MLEGYRARERGGGLAVLPFKMFSLLFVDDDGDDGDGVFGGMVVLVCSSGYDTTVVVIYGLALLYYHKEGRPSR